MAEKIARGQYRERGQNGLPNSVWVTDGTIGFDMTEDIYRARGYEPTFDALPWKEEYDSLGKKE